MSGFMVIKRGFSMKIALNSEMARFVDQYTIEEIGVPGVVLMEKAAMAVSEAVIKVIKEFNRNVRIAVVCGCGNNGADGIALSRILFWKGIKAEVIIVGDENKATSEFILQKTIAVNSQLVFGNISNIKEYDIIVDALFGTGLSRAITGKYADVINSINDSDSYVISVDIPSGINASDGKVLGVAVKAQMTVTFGYNKIGMLLFPGRLYADKVIVEDIGFYPFAVKDINPVKYLTDEDINEIPKRLDYSNKGTYSRTLIIAGSEDMSGAAYLSAAAAYRCGVGLVEIFSNENNAAILKTLLPEAIISGYNDENALDKLENKIKTADIIVLGPGLSTNRVAVDIVKFVLENTKTPIIIDADALNIISRNRSILKNSQSTVIITPHIGEMMRLADKSKEDILENLIFTATEFAKEYGVVCVLKDSATVIADMSGEEVYINTSGCSAMAKAGSGDVLTGVIAAMLALGLKAHRAAAMGVYIHGLAGENAVRNQSNHSMLASDMLNEFGEILK